MDNEKDKNNLLQRVVEMTNVKSYVLMSNVKGERLSHMSTLVDV